MKTAGSQWISVSFWHAKLLQRQLGSGSGSCFHRKFQEFVRHLFICFYLMIACSAPLTIRLWHFHGSEWLHFFFFFLSRSCETWMCCIHTSIRLGVSLFRCSAFETITLNHSTQPSLPLGAPSSPYTSLGRDGGKRILSQNNWQLRGRGNKDESRMTISRSTHPWLLLVKTWHVSHLTATIGPKHSSWQPRYQMMKLQTIY